MLTIKIPEEYVNEPDIVGHAGKYIKKYGKKAYIIGSKTSLQVVGEEFYESLNQEEISYRKEEYNGYPTRQIIYDISLNAKKYGADVIIGMGGGRICDISKAVGNECNIPIVTVPTVAATCAAWAAVSIIYEKDGNFDTFYRNEQSPKLILADTKILLTAPERYTYSGLVDTLAKWYETAPRLKTAEDDITLQVGVSGGKLAFDVLEKYGKKAVEDGKRGIIGTAAKQTVDAIIYLAGFVGSFQSDSFYGGFAHPFYHISTRIASTRRMLHGEKVAFGIVTQLVLEGKPLDTIRKVIRDFHTYQEDFTLEELGFSDRVIEEVHQVATEIFETFHEFTSLGYGQSVEAIEAGIWEADRLIKKERETL